jgi:hypothetical protein
VNTSLPYPRSPVIRELRWVRGGIIRIGNNAGDNWPITWGEGDVQYVAYGDGRGFSDRKPRLSLSVAWIIGDPPNHRGEDVPTGIDTPEGQGPRGVKASGLLMVDGVLYLFVRNNRSVE